MDLKGILSKAVYMINLRDLSEKKDHWEDPEGSGGEEGGRGDRDGEYMYIQGWFMSMYDKTHYNIVK